MFYEWNETQRIFGHYLARTYLKKYTFKTNGGYFFISDMNANMYLNFCYMTKNKLKIIGQCVNVFWRALAPVMHYILYVLFSKALYKPFCILIICGKCLNYSKAWRQVCNFNWFRHEWTPYYLLTFSIMKFMSDHMSYNRD